jgi:thiamine biosynthesis lipoprotein
MFDITVGPVVNLWGFGPKNKPHKIPTESELEFAKKRVGYKYLRVRLNPPAIKKRYTRVYCDLSAIAKGFGVDKVSELLLKKNITNHLVEIGGELKAHGKKFNSDWVVGISVPDQSLSMLQDRIALNNLSMATSGDYWNYFEENGQRYSHTINPKTGKPITHNLASITVISPSCMLADAYATAIDVMGPTKGMIFANRNKLNAYFITKEKDKFKTSFTEGFKKFLMQGN